MEGGEHEGQGKERCGEDVKGGRASMGKHGS